MINGLHHVAISTHDIQRIVTFYTEVLGFTIVSDSGWPLGHPEIDDMIGLKDSSAKVIMLQAGNCFIEVFEYYTPRGVARDPNYPVSDTGHTHIGLNVTDIETEYTRLSEAGMRFHSAPINVGPPGSIRAAYGRDPDGNVVELVEVFSKSHSCYLEKAPYPDLLGAE